MQHSIRDAILRNDNPAWVARIALGLRLLVIGSIIEILRSIDREVAPQWLTLTITRFVGWGVGIVELAGVWIVTRPNPRGFTHEIIPGGLKIIRWGWLALLLWSFVIQSIIGLADWTSWLPAMSLAAKLAMLVELVITFLLISSLALLAARIPDQKLRAYARVLRWIILIPAVILILVDTALTLVNISIPAQFDWQRRLLSHIPSTLEVLTYVQIAIDIAVLALYLRLAIRIQSQAELAVDNATAESVATGQKPIRQ